MAMRCSLCEATTPKQEPYGWVKATFKCFGVHDSASVVFKKDAVICDKCRFEHGVLRELLKD